MPFDWDTLSKIVTIASPFLGLGALAGFASFIWQVVSWRRSGALVRVSVEPGEFFEMRGEAMTLESRRTWGLWVTATNRGRLATQISLMGLWVEGRGQGQLWKESLGPGESYKSWISQIEVEKALTRRRRKGRLRAYVITGHGTFFSDRIDRRVLTQALAETTVLTRDQMSLEERNYQRDADQM